MPSGCKRNTQSRSVKDLREDPSQRGLSFIYFVCFGFLFVLFVSFFHLPRQYCGSLVETCMSPPRSCLCMASAWLLSFVPERETKTFIHVKIMKSPTLASCPLLLSSCCLGLVLCSTVIMTVLLSFLPQQRPAPTHPPNSQSSGLIDESPRQEAGLRLLTGLGRV